MAFRKPTGYYGYAKPPHGSRINWGDPITKGLVARWLFNDRQNSGIQDSARNYHARIYTTTVNTMGAFGQGPLLFNATDGKARVEDYGSATGKRPIVTALPFSFVGWACQTTAGQAVVIASTADEATNDAYFMLSINSSNQFSASNGDASNTSAAAGGSVVVGQWYQLVGVWTTTTDRKIYANGRLIASDTSSRPTDLTLLDNFCFGALVRNTQAFGSGKIDNISVYNRILHPNEIARLYTEPFAGIARPKRNIMQAIGGAGSPLTTYFLAIA